MTRSSAKRANGNALAVVNTIPPAKADQWRDEYGAFDEIGVRALARTIRLEVDREINWAFAAEILNRQTAVEWL
jgi:hypothetical protein